MKNLIFIIFFFLLTNTSLASVFDCYVKYKFGGSNISIMTEFNKNFGDSVIMKLEDNFRFGQSMTDISSFFIQKNKNQIPKTIQNGKGKLHIQGSVIGFNMARNCVVIDVNEMN